MTRPSRDPALNAASSHVHSRLHLYPSAHANTSVAANASSSMASIPAVPIRNPINSEDARLLDPSYLSSVPLTSHSGPNGHLISSAENTGNSGGIYTHAIPYIDSQGTLHDPDYRPFPLISHAKQTAPSPFAVRKPYWESADEEESENSFGNSFEEDEGESDGSTPSTPTSTTPFMRYFLETHPLNHGSPLSHSKHSSKPSGPSRDSYDHGLNKTKKRAGPGRRPCAPPQLKVTTTCVYASIATGCTRVYTRSRATSTLEGPTTGLPVSQFTTALSSNPPVADDVSLGKEKRGWGGLLRKAGKREGGEKE